jgi:hypothetical protein
MTRRLYAAALAALMVMTATPLSAQQQIEWKQTLNTPKGLNMPSGVKADILGIELGDTYADVKAKLERWLAEAPQAAPAASPCPPRHPNMPPCTCEAERRAAMRMMGGGPRPPVTQVERKFHIPVTGSSVVIAGSYIGEISAEREMPGTGQGKNREFFQVHFTSPASGHQAVYIERTISYAETADQPRVGQLIAAIKEKFKTDLWADGGVHEVLFDNGKPVLAGQHSNVVCGLLRSDAEARDIPGGNNKGICDVLLRLSITFGISKDHVRTVAFSLHDNERTKLNLTADYAFITNYVKALQDRTKGPQPKL